MFDAKRLLFPAVSSAAMLWASLALADPCDPILAQGIWQSQSSNSALSDTKDFQDWACNSSSAGGGGGGFSASATTSACSSSNNYSNYTNTQQSSIQTVAESTVNTWLKCMEGPGRIGSWASIVFHDDNRVEVKLRNQQGRTNRVAATIQLAGNIIDCKGNEVKKSKAGPIRIERDGQEADAVCERTDNGKSADILISFDDGTSANLHLPAVPKAQDDPIRPKIIRIETPVYPGDKADWPGIDETRNRVFPLKDGDLLGIGHIVDPGVNPGNLTGTPFALHRDKGEEIAPDTYVTYYFDKPASVASLEIYQHANGVLKVEGFVGDDPNHLTSIGSAPDPARRQPGNAVFPNGEMNDFYFDRPGQGTIFRFKVTQASNPDNRFGLYKAVPLDLHHKRFGIEYWN